MPNGNSGQDEFDQYKVKPQGDEFDQYKTARAATSSAPSLPTGSYQARKGGPILNADESALHTAVRGLEGTIGSLGEHGESPNTPREALGNVGRNLGKLGVSALKDPLAPVHGLATGIEESAKDIETGLPKMGGINPLGHAGGGIDWRSIGQGAGATIGARAAMEAVGRPVEAALPKIGAAALAPTKSLGIAGDYLGENLRLPKATEAYPKGQLKPGTRAAARLLGAGVGHLTGVPGIGEFGGWVVGPGLADMIIPEHPNLPGPFAKLPVRMPKTGIEAAPKPTLFPDATSSISPIGNEALPRPGLPQLGTSAIVPAKTTFVEKFRPPERSKIIQPGTPEAEPPHVEGSYWSFKEPALRKAVMAGDRDAAIVYKQRFGGLPEGAGFLTDVAQGPTRGLYRSR